MIAIRRATLADAETLARMRADSSFERKGRDEAARVEHVRVCTAFFTRELGDPNSFLRSWIATLDGAIVGAASLAVIPTLPRFGFANSGYDGRVRDVYVFPAARRRGVARALMTVVIAAAKAEPVDRLTLGASDMGMPLYLALGFVRKPDEMVLPDA